MSHVMFSSDDERSWVSLGEMVGRLRMKRASADVAPLRAAPTFDEIVRRHQMEHRRERLRILSTAPNFVDAAARVMDAIDGRAMRALPAGDVPQITDLVRGMVGGRFDG